MGEGTNEKIFRVSGRNRTQDLKVQETTGELGCLNEFL